MVYKLQNSELSAKEMYPYIALFFTKYYGGTLGYTLHRFVKVMLFSLQWACENSLVKNTAE